MSDDDGWTKFNGTWADFSDQNLNKAGTLVDIHGCGPVLIGDINTLRGVCDDCVLCDRKAKVLRYKIVYEP